MAEQKIFIIGNDDIVMLLGLVGIEGKILENPESFIKEFNILLKKPLIGMIIIALDLPSEMIDYITDFKLNNRRPIVFYLPNMFRPNLENEDIFYNKILNSINKIITQ